MELRYVVLILAMGLIVPVSAMRDTIDVCAEAGRQQVNNEFWGKRFVMLTGQLEKRAADKYDIRQLTVDRVLFGDVSYQHKDQCTVTIGGMVADGYLTGPGKYLLLFQRLDDGKLLLSDDVILRFGPVVNYLELQSFDDPIISDAQIAIDTLSIPSDAMRWERMVALWPRVKNHPFVRECFLRAIASQYITSMRDYNYGLEAIFREPEKYSASTVLFADQLRRGVNPMHPVPSLRKWSITNKQANLLDKLAAELPIFDPNRRFLRIPRTAAMTEIRHPLSPVEEQRLRDVYAPDVWPAAAVVDFPNVAPKATRCTVNMERIISGEQLLVPGKQDILLRPGVAPPPAGKYVVFFTGTGDGKGRDIACYGQNILVLGSVINYSPVVSANDPAVDDLSSLILFTRERDIALWQPVRTDALDAKRHPLLVNFNLRQTAARVAMIEKTFNQIALEVLHHPQEYSLQFVVLTDRLFTAPEFNFDSISDEARKWQTLPERRTLFLDLQSRLTPADNFEPYYSSAHVNEVLKEFNKTAK